MKNAKPVRKPVSSPKPRTGAAKPPARDLGPSNSPPDSASAVSEKMNSSLRILLVEDHEETRRSIQRLLEYSGHKVSAAASAAEAMKIAAGNSFNLVVSDLGLPDQPGHELMAELNRLYGLSGIALSGYDADDHIERNRQAGFREHLTKPINFDQLNEMITQFSRFIP